MARGYLARKFKNKRRRAVIKIQAWWRGYRTRKIWRPKIKSKANERLQKEHQEQAKKKAAEAKIEQIKKKGGDIAAALDNDDLFDGLSDEEKARQKDLLKYLENSEKDRQDRAENRLKQVAVNDYRGELGSVGEVVTDLPADLEHILNWDVIQSYPPMIYDVPYVPILQLEQCVPSTPPDNQGNKSNHIIRINMGEEDKEGSLATLAAGDLQEDSKDGEKANLNKIGQIYCRDGQNLKSSKYPIKQSLLKLSSEAALLSIDLYKSVLKYVYEGNTVEQHVQLINYMVSKVVEQPPLVDELYCQVLKQTNENPSRCDVVFCLKIALCLFICIVSSSLEPGSFCTTWPVF